MRRNGQAMKHTQQGTTQRSSSDAAAAGARNAARHRTMPPAACPPGLAVQAYPEGRSRWQAGVVDPPCIRNIGKLVSNGQRCRGQAVLPGKRRRRPHCLQAVVVQAKPTSHPLLPRSAGCLRVHRQQRAAAQPGQRQQALHR